jgi:hypothetical protein
LPKSFWFELLEVTKRLLKDSVEFPPFPETLATLYPPSPPKRVMELESTDTAPEEIKSTVPPNPALPLTSGGLLVLLPPEPPRIFTVEEIPLWV